MDDYLADIIKNDKVEELKEKYKNYIRDKKHDILMYTTENTTSLEIFSSVIKWYDTLNYKAYSEKFDEYNSPLRVAFALNKFDFANLLLENNASIDYDPMDPVNYNKYLNNENLYYMIDIGYPFNDEILFGFFEKLIYGNDNDITTLEKCLKCLLIDHNKDLDFSKKGFKDDIYKKIKDKDVLNALLKYESDNKKSDKILPKTEKNKKYYNNDYDDYYDYDDYDYDDYFDESQCSASYFYPDDYEEF